MTNTWKKAGFVYSQNWYVACSLINGGEKAGKGQSLLRSMATVLLMIQ